MNNAALSVWSAGDVIDGQARGHGPEPLRGAPARLAQRPVGDQHLGHRVRLLRAREQVALTILASELVEPPVLSRFLDPLGDDAQPERPAKGHDRACECPLLLALSGADELPRDLEDIDPEAAKVTER